MVDPATEEAQQQAEDELEAAAIAIETAVLLVVARRVSSFRDGQTLTQALASMPADMAEVDAIITRGSRLLEETSRGIMERMATGNDQWAKRYYDATLSKQSLFRDHAGLSQALSNGMDEVIGDIRTTCRTSVMGLQGRSGVLPFEEEYKAIINEAAHSMAVGEAAYDQAVLNAARNLSQGGLRVVYESWQTRELYAAVRTNVMDAYRSTMVEMRMIQGAEFGADGVEISAHAPCAPDHEKWQGQQFTFKEYADLQSILRRPFVFGANCHHTISPIIIGITNQVYSDSELAEMREMSNEEVTFESAAGNELTMTRYEATQYQRSVEKGIRDARTQGALLDAFGSKEAGIVKSNADALESYYVGMSKSLGLGTRMERTEAYVMVQS